MSSEVKTYNGYANYESWAVALWIDNEHGLYDERREMATRAWDDAEEDTEPTQTSEERSDKARYAFAQAIEEWVEEMAPDLGASLFSDLLNAALSEVDWYELADNWLNEEINENGTGGYETK